MNASNVSVTCLAATTTSYIWIFSIHRWTSVTATSWNPKQKITGNYRGRRAIRKVSLIFLSLNLSWYFYHIYVIFAYVPGELKRLKNKKIQLQPYQIGNVIHQITKMRKLNLHCWQMDTVRYIYAIWHWIELNVKFFTFLIGKESYFIIFNNIEI